MKEYIVCVNAKVYIAFTNNKWEKFNIRKTKIK